MSASNPQAADDARMWRTADLGGLELLRATLSEFAFRPHAHEEFFIALTETGLARPPTGAPPTWSAPAT